MDKRLLNLVEYINESNAFAAKVEFVKPSLSRAADIVAKFVNKKTGLKFLKFPFAHTANLDGQDNTGVMFYSAKVKLHSEFQIIHLVLLEL